MRALSRAQGTAVRSRQEHIKLSQALHHLFGWRTPILSLGTLRPVWNSINTAVACAQHFASGEAGATVGFWAGATEGFGQSCPGHIAIHCTLSERCCVTVKSEAQPEDSSHFTSFLVICHPMLVLGRENDLVVGTIISKHHDRDSAPSLAVIFSGPLFDSGHPSHRRLWNLGRIVLCSQSSRHCQKWCGLVFDLNKVVLYDVWLLVTVLAPAPSHLSHHSTQ